MKVEIQNDESGPYFLILGEDKPIEVRVEFNARHEIGLKTDLLAKAVGFKKGESFKIIDGTAGLCRDSFHLASLGLDVTALESHPQIFSVVSEQLIKLPKDIQLKLVHTETEKYLRSLSIDERPRVIYLDPMFPEKTKSAKSGKESELLKLLAPIAQPEAEAKLLAVARQTALKRVVVKRPLLAPPMAGQKPDTSYKGRSVRYDVYFNLI